MAGSLQQFIVRSEARFRIPLMALAVGVFLVAVVFLGRNLGGDAEVAEPTSTTTSSTTTSSTTEAPARPGIAGFDPVAFSITTPTGEVREHCGLLAESADQLAQGLKGQDGLGGYDGMIFTFAESTRSAFYMADVPVPLSIAWFDGEGRFVSSADMAVCEVAEADCPLYQATAPFRFALETMVGDMGDLGVGTNSVLELGGSCS